MTPADPWPPTMSGTRQRGLAMTANTDVSSAIVRTLVPARMDRLPWTASVTCRETVALP